MQEGIFEEFSKAVVEKVNKFKLGGGMDPNTTLGPLISQAAVDRVRSCTFTLDPLFAPIFAPPLKAQLLTPSMECLERVRAQCLE